jgi:hypothetical protein
MEPNYFSSVSGAPVPRLDRHAHEYIEPLVYIDNPDPTIGQPALILIFLLGGGIYGGVIHWALAILILLLAVAGGFGYIFHKTRHGVRIYQDGIISRTDESPLGKTKTWIMFPWPNVIDIDLRYRSFFINHTGHPTLGSGSRVLIKIDRAHAKGIAERLEALQVRGDIPKNIKVWSK